MTRARGSFSTYLLRELRTAHLHGRALLLPGADALGQPVRGALSVELLLRLRLRVRVRVRV